MGMPALRACREFLYSVLPDGKRDQLLIEWGFEPWDMPVAHKPEDQKFVMHEYDPATDIVKLRLEEDVLADEFIIEAAKTPSPAPPNWVPVKFEIFATSDEPFFELGPLTETLTIAFRPRAKNKAGYGSYWMRFEEYSNHRLEKRLIEFFLRGHFSLDTVYNGILF